MPEENSKAKRDLDAAKKAVDKVEFARKELAALLGADIDGIEAAEEQARVASAPANEAGPNVGQDAEQPHVVVAEDGVAGMPAAQGFSVAAPNVQSFGQPVQGSDPFGQPVYGQVPVQPAVQQAYVQHPYAQQPQAAPQQPYMQQPQAAPQQAYVQQPYAPQPQAAYNQVPPAQQAYTPQLQQPAGYVPAQDFTVQPQPTTPAYTKSNKPTTAILIAVVIGIVAIIVAAVLGRILATQATDYQSPIINQLDSIEEDVGLNNNSENYSDHNGGKDENDTWSFNWDDDKNEGDIDWDSDVWDDSHGANHIYGGGIDADDGELHQAWDKTVGYSYSEGEFKKEGIETIDFYAKTIAYDFDVEYPQFKGENIANVDAINKAIEEKAMRFVDYAYTKPSAEIASMFESYADVPFGVPSQVDGILESDVDYAISYNNNDFVSICFSDEYSVGSWAGSFISLRTVNANLKTGELYELNDVLSINEDIAESFVDNLSTYDNGQSVDAAGRADFIAAIQGKGPQAENVTTTFFIDGNGKVNLGVSYRLDNNEAVARGWWDYTLTDEQLEAAKKDSSLWDLIAAG